jgi:hypothetical protein
MTPNREAPFLLEIETKRTLVSLVFHKKTAPFLGAFLYITKTMKHYLFTWEDSPIPPISTHIWYGFSVWTPANDNLKGTFRVDLTEVLREIFDDRQSLWEFTTYLIQEYALSGEEKHFLDEMFWAFDYSQHRRQYTTIDCKRLYISICNKLRNQPYLHNPLFLRNIWFFDSFNSILQADISTYLSQTHQKGDISKIVGLFAFQTTSILLQRSRK